MGVVEVHGSTPERLYQAHFQLQGDSLGFTTSQDVTPAHFRQIDFPPDHRERRFGN